MRHSSTLDPGIILRYLCFIFLPGLDGGDKTVILADAITHRYAHTHYNCYICHLCVDICSANGDSGINDGGPDLIQAFKVRHSCLDSAFCQILKLQQLGQ